jgi:hypothetical protein
MTKGTDTFLNTLRFVSPELAAYVTTGRTFVKVGLQMTERLDVASQKLGTWIVTQMRELDGNTYFVVHEVKMGLTRIDGVASYSNTGEHRLITSGESKLLIADYNAQKEAKEKELELKKERAAEAKRKAEEEKETVLLKEKLAREESERAFKEMQKSLQDAVKARKAAEQARKQAEADAERDKMFATRIMEEMQNVTKKAEEAEVTAREAREKAEEAEKRAKDAILQDQKHREQAEKDLENARTVARQAEENARRAHEEAEQARKRAEEETLRREEETQRLAEVQKAAEQAEAEAERLRKVADEKTQNEKDIIEKVEEAEHNVQVATEAAQAVTESAIALTSGLATDLTQYEPAPVQTETQSIIMDEAETQEELLPENIHRETLKTSTVVLGSNFYLKWQIYLQLLALKATLAAFYLKWKGMAAAMSGLYQLLQLALSVANRFSQLFAKREENPTKPPAPMVVKKAPIVVKTEDATLMPLGPSHSQKGSRSNSGTNTPSKVPRASSPALNAAEIAAALARTSRKNLPSIKEK